MGTSEVASSTPALCHSPRLPPPHLGFGSSATIATAAAALPGGKLPASLWLANAISAVAPGGGGGAPLGRRSRGGTCTAAAPTAVRAAGGPAVEVARLATRRPG